MAKKTKKAVKARGVEGQQNILQQALAHHRAGRLPRAEALYRQILRAEPDNPEALHFLGMLAHQAGKSRIAAAMIEKALSSKPDYVDAYNSLAMIHVEQGKMDDAAATFRRALSIKPDYAELHSNLGNTLKAQGRLDEAAACYRKALALKPEYAEAHNNLANVLKEQGRLDEAAACYQKAINVKPDIAEPHNNLGIVLKELGKFDEAAASYRQAFRLKPDYAEPHNNLGNLLKEQGKLDEAAASYGQALAVKPDYVDALNNLGSALADQYLLDEAIANFRRALALKPDFALLHLNLGTALKDKNRLDEAITCYKKALSLKPDYAEAHNGLGNALINQGKPNDAIACYRQALSVKSDYNLAHSNLLLCLNYLHDISQKELYEEAQEWDQQHGQPLLEKNFLYENSRDPNRRLRIGYVSSDFKEHSVSNFIEPVLSSHNRQNVEVYCYANVLRPDERTRRFRDMADSWYSIAGIPDDAVVERLRRDKVDILVDLGGHTAQNRLLVFACKPAPVQVTWLGYPNTTGLQTMDYRFTDAVADPPGEADTLHTEKLFRLLHGFLCFQPHTSAPEVGPLPCRELGYITFGSFNKLAKITPEVIRSWAGILRAVPGSRLLLKAGSLTDPYTRQRYMELFAEEGIAADRLELHGWLPGKRDHLEFYHRVDIGLDPFPYNGTTTTCEALWMGVPVITFCGNRHAGRVGASIMHQAGLRELVADSPAAYSGLAVSLAQDRSRLSALRNSLRLKMRKSPLVDKALFTETLEKAYREMWRKWCGETG